MSKYLDRLLYVAAVLGSLVLLNALARAHFGRVDLTEDHRYTLSEATRNTLESLPDPVTVRAYFSADLPAPYSATARYVRDLLEEYHTASGGKVRFEFIDPVAKETEEDKETKKEVKRDIFGRPVREMTSVERELESLGIPPVQVQVSEEDEIQVKRAYMGIAVLYGDKSESIPVVQDTDGLEYELTRIIRKLTREKPPKVLVAKGFGVEDPQQAYGQLWQLLSADYTVEAVDLGAEEPKLPDDADALLVIGPKEPLSEKAKRAINTFVMQGRPVAFFAGPIEPDLQRLRATPLQHGLSDLLSSWGVKIEEGLVVDPECATIAVTQQRGFMRIQQPVPYPFIPTPKQLDPNHPITQGLGGVNFPFVSPLSVTPMDGVEATVLAASSPQSWVVKPPYDINPLQRWTQDKVTEQGAHPLAVALTGKLPNAFAVSSPEGGEASDAGPEAAENGRVVVVGTHLLLADEFMGAPNAALVMNLMDWMLEDEALLAVRTRGLRARPLEIEGGARSALKWGDAVGLPAVFVLFGLVRWRMREARRKRVTL
ncbi:MAG: ABC transporter permease [Deltaproteobacteria bacterium]|nr:MAG: ABC transporter permease [Deltaproteobacteria bacterium]